jgi:glycosyltransferase involved in cell wall biosynthesis
MKKSLLIISDTPFYCSNNTCFVFEPTLREVEEVADLFSTIKWISYRRDGRSRKNAVAPSISNLQLRPIKNLRGGKSIFKKFLVFISIPWQAFLLYREILSFQVIHTRAPSVPALLVIIFSFFDSKRVYWHKYAGNWSEPDPPLAYWLQNWLLRKLDRQNVRITINGKWPGLHKGFLFMENPCLKSHYLEGLRMKQDSKEFKDKLRVCFVGNLDPFKGAIRLVKALLCQDVINSIDSIWIVGDGYERKELENIAATSPVPIHICGYLSREEIFKTIYANCHIMVLPSETEGFPKVVSEAAAHHCIPVATSVSAINQYIVDGVNGFLLPDSSVDSIRDVFLNKIIGNPNLAQVANHSFIMADKFTYEKFRERIKNEILTR